MIVNNMETSCESCSTSPLSKFESYQSAANARQEVVPKDKYHIVRISMHLFGITSLLPWNFFIQANDYWMYRFRNVSAPIDSDVKTELQTTFSSYLAIASKVPYVVFLLANAAISNRFLPSIRIKYPLIFMILLFAVTSLLVEVNTDKHQTLFFAVTICIVVLINASCGFVQGGGTGIAGCLPPEYMGYNVNGMAVGGILASAVQILSLLGETDPLDSACIYFWCATLALCVTFVFFLLMLKSEFYQFFMAKQISTSRRNTAVHFIQQEALEVTNFALFKKVWVYAISITLIFWVTLSVLPAIVVLVEPVSKAKSIWTGRLFLPMACFLLFNVSDFVGRVVAERFTMPSPYKYLVLSLTFLRITFVPLLMLCNAHPREHLPVVFNSDVSFIVIIVFFAISNGYLCNVILVHGPKEVQVEHQEMAGSLLAFFLGLGLMLGSVSSYGLIKLL